MEPYDVDVEAITFRFDDEGVTVAAAVFSHRSPRIFAARWIGGNLIDVRFMFGEQLARRGLVIERVSLAVVADDLARLVAAVPSVVFDYVGGAWREAVTA